MPGAFGRQELLLGREAMRRLKNSRVAVFGIGGVGSYCVEGLVRAGVGKIVLVDDDFVSLTNINRQLHATQKTIGESKVEAMRARALEINPDLEIEACARFYLPGCDSGLVRADYDYIVDAMDTMASKVGLVLAAKQMGIPIISCMGAGNKLDPTRFRVADVYQTSVCPLAKIMRRELRKRGVESLKVVYSTELPQKPLLPEERVCEHACAGSAETWRGRPRRRLVPGSVSFVPSVAGLILAGEVVKDLASCGQAAASGIIGSKAEDRSPEGGA